jgi:hypothetical protein
VWPEWTAIMNDVEDLLREGMERFTRELRAPAGLTWQAARRHRRRLAQRSMGAAAAGVAVAGVAVLAAVVPSALPTGAQAATTAFVVKQVSSALSAADPGDIAQIDVTRSIVVPNSKALTTTAEEWSYGDRWRSITTSSGHPVYDEGVSASSVYTLVSYGTRTWARQRGLGRPNAPVFGALGLGFAPALRARSLGYGSPAASPSPVRFARVKSNVFIPRRCRPVVAAAWLLFQPGLPGFGFSAVSLPAARALRDAISCGALAVAGRQRLDGIDAIKLTSRRRSPISETIWVTPRSYLPVRVIVRSAPAYSADAAAVLRQTADITWLQPTAHNLAELTVPVPAGFRQVREFPLAVALQTILERVPRGLPRLYCLRPGGPACTERTGASGASRER